ncbi:MAG: cytochrome c oxidase subunit II [Actinobacteria bacterium]|nr:cytochrome c oxidase subunit II [Actinomycetota bacterium]
MSGSTRSDFASVWSLYLWIGIGVAVLVLAAILFAVVRYRDRPGRVASGPDERTAVEIGAAVVILAIVALLVFRTFHTEAEEDNSSATDAVRIEVDAFQWGWKFTYPGQGVTVIGNNDREPNFAVPAGRRVSFALTSSDVIHAMWIPEQRFKKDAIPHRVNHFDMEFEELGREQGLCSEFCGFRHSGMRFGVLVMSDKGYGRWLATHR